MIVDVFWEIIEKFNLLKDAMKITRESNIVDRRYGTTHMDQLFKYPSSLSPNPFSAPTVLSLTIEFKNNMKDLVINEDTIALLERFDDSGEIAVFRDSDIFKIKEIKECTFTMEGVYDTSEQEEGIRFYEIKMKNEEQERLFN